MSLWIKNDVIVIVALLYANKSLINSKELKSLSKKYFYEKYQPI